MNRLNLTRLSFVLFLSLVFPALADAGKNKLLDAVKANDVALVKVLLSTGADANEKSLYGGPLNVAAGQGSAGIVAALIDAGANLETPGLAGTHPLHSATATGQAETVKLLIARGAIVDALDGYGRTPLLIAVLSSNNFEVIQVLLAAGADPTVKDGGYHKTALSWAAGVGRVDAAFALLAAGVDVNVRDGGLGEAAIHYAIDHNNLDFVKFLIAHGADVNIVNNEGETPLQYAKKKNLGNL